jgi:hypothetical protein
MNGPKQITEYAWRSGDFPLCVIDVPVAELAERWGIALAHWDEPGLGPASGFACRVGAAGLVVFLEELAHARESLGAPGPTLIVEAAELVERGIDSTLATVLSHFGLSDRNVTWVRTDAGLQHAKWVMASKK